MGGNHNPFRFIKRNKMKKGVSTKCEVHSGHSLFSFL